MRRNEGCFKQTEVGGVKRMGREGRKPPPAGLRKSYNERQLRECSGMERLRNDSVRLSCCLAGRDANCVDSFRTKTQVC